MSAFAELAGQAWQATKDGRELEARLLLGAAVTALAPDGVKPVIVGGTAVDFWAADTTGGSLSPSKLIRASKDIDIVVGGFYGDDKRLRRALQASGLFEPARGDIDPELRRTWYGTTVPVQVEIIGQDLVGDPGRVATVEIGDGVAYLWGVEDTLWQYAENTISQRDRNDWARALAIRGAQDLDWAYLKERAAEDGMGFLIKAIDERWDYDAVQTATA